MIEIRDERQQAWFWMDNAVIDIYGPQIGAYGLAVYMALARHANGSRMCWPSYETLANELGLSRRKVIDVAKQLRDLKLIAITRRSTTSEDGSEQFSSNIFTLLIVQEMHSASEQHSPGVVNSMHQPSEQHAPKQDTVNKTQLEGSQNAVPQNEPTTTTTTVSKANPPVTAVIAQAFEPFWLAYPTRPNGSRGTKKHALGEFAKLSSDDKALLPAAIERQRRMCGAQGEISWPKDMERFIRDEDFRTVVQAPAPLPVNSNGKPVVRSSNYLTAEELRADAEERKAIPRVNMRAVFAASHPAPVQPDALFDEI